MVRLRVGGCFSGIGGFELGMLRAGHEIAWMIEKNDYRRALLRQDFPGAFVTSDVSIIDPEWDWELEDVDVHVVGFPCQDVSGAGLRAGIEGQQSSLWFTYVERLLRPLRPQYVVVENVTGLLARGFPAVLADLAALGFDAEWQCIPAATFGAPHGRDRLWLVAWQPPGAYINEISARAHRTMADTRRFRSSRSRGTGCVGANLLAGRRETVVNSAVYRRSLVPDAVYECCPGTIFCKHSLEAHAKRSSRRFWSPERQPSRVDDGISTGMDATTRTKRLAALGDSLIPAAAEYIGHRIAAHATYIGYF